MVDFNSGGKPSDYKTLPRSENPVSGVKLATRQIDAGVIAAPKVPGLEQQPGVGMAILSGGMAAFLGAIVWALITSLTGYKFSIATIGIGYLTAYAIVRFGGGQKPVNGVLSVALTVAGCLFGIIFMVCIVGGKEAGVPAGQVFHVIPLGTLLSAGFSPIDGLFMLFSVVSAFRIGHG